MYVYCTEFYYENIYRNIISSEFDLNVSDSWSFLLNMLELMNTITISHIFSIHAPFNIHDNTIT